MKRHLIPFDPRHAQPSYAEFGKGKPKCIKEKTPIRVIKEMPLSSRISRRIDKRLVSENAVSKKIDEAREVLIGKPLRYCVETNHKQAEIN